MKKIEVGEVGQQEITKDEINIKSTYRQNYRSNEKYTEPSTGAKKGRK